MNVIPEIEEVKSSCSCCGRELYSSYGDIVVGDETVAGYWYRWANGHEGRFSLAIQWHHPELGMRVVALGAEAMEEGIRYSLLDPCDSPFGDLSDFGDHLDREKALVQADLVDFWGYVDAVASADPGLAKHIKAHYKLT